MARNKYPEETKKRIMEVSMKLFVEKGYEKTSIQDIINELGDLTKGAIYYHFKSKDDILNEVTDRMTESSNRRLLMIQHEKGLTGKEKLKKIFTMSIDRPEQDMLFQAAPDLRKNPQILSKMLTESVEITAVDYLLPIMEEGIRDGSIQTRYPLELAEALLLLGNTWLNPMLFQDDLDKTYRKFCTYKQMLEAMGLDIVDDYMLERLLYLADTLRQNKEKGE